MIEVEKDSSSIKIMQEKDDIERQKSINKKDGLIMERTTRIENNRKNLSAIEIIQKKKLDIIDEDREKGMIRKGIVKEMLERIERQGNSILTNSSITLRKELDIEKDIERERDIMRKEKGSDSSKKNDILREKIDERLKSIERTMIYTQDMV